MELDTVESKLPHWGWMIFFLCIIFYSCVAKKALPGIYQSYDDSYGAGYNFQSLILNDDSTFQYLYYGDELCYVNISSACGTWKMDKDTLRFKLFDTIPLAITYYSDTSDFLKLELFDKFGCQYFNPAYIFPPVSNEIEVIGYGLYQGRLGPDVKKLNLYYPAEDLVSIPVKQDSMKVKVDGLSVNGISAERLNFFRKGNKLAYRIGMSNQRRTKTHLVKLSRRDYLDYFHLMYDN